MRILMLANKYSAMNMSATKPEKIFEILFNLSFNKMLPTYCTMSGGFGTKRDKLEYVGMQTNGGLIWGLRYYTPNCIVAHRKMEGLI